MALRLDGILRLQTKNLLFEYVLGRLIRIIWILYKVLVNVIWLLGFCHLLYFEEVVIEVDCFHERSGWLLVSDKEMFWVH
jgi:hypothetical protein